MKSKAFVAAAILVVLIPLTVSAQVVFSDDFEGGLGQWSGKNLGGHSGVIVVDPHNPENHVVTFMQTTDRGDIFSQEIHVTNGEMLVLHFDYLGLPVVNSIPGSYGGFVGYADDTDPETQRGCWLAATDPISEADPILIDDGTWHSYTVIFDPYDIFTPVGGVIRIKVQDHIDPTGDVFFDNFLVERLGPVATKESTWGRVKALYRTK
jgi:hypothetical protein